MRVGTSYWEPEFQSRIREVFWLDFFFFLGVIVIVLVYMFANPFAA